MKIKIYNPLEKKIIEVDDAAILQQLKLDQADFPKHGEGFTKVIKMYVDHIVNPGTGYIKTKHKNEDPTDKQFTMTDSALAHNTQADDDEYNNCHVPSLGQMLPGDMGGADVAGGKEL